jgi:hypothetical protein
VDVWIGTGAREAATAVAMTIDPFNNAVLKLLWRCSPRQIALMAEIYASQPQAAVVVRHPV